MTDIEKAIRGLTACTDNTPTEDCRKCPYQGEEYCTDAVMLDALALLQEKEPVEPFHKCSEGLYPFTLVSNKDFAFCPYCGRRIKYDA